MLIEVKNLNKTYYSGKINFKALNDINFSLEKGEFTALVGPSGSGKTTLLNCIGCIDNPDNGEIFLEGENIIFSKPDKQAELRRENFGFIFQTYNLIPVLTVYENIELPLKILKRYNDGEIKKMVLSILDEVGLSGLDKRKPLELSGGQQQRVSIARALVKKPKIIFADEPTANLDSATGEAIVDLMKNLNEKDKITFLFSTHDQLIMKHARRLVHIRDGKLSESEV
ncbi:MAG: ABC transporter ATP-binding protein [Spirochaetes bacterium]|nr:ABC transporter ATP-binding protein [Spirochaetota bacterium]